jgi:histidinol-phosphate phosphatase family protein
MKCDVAILAGGQGTRLLTRSGDLPKPMVPILGKPLLQYQIELCKKFGFTKIALLVHYQHEIISKYFGDGSKFGVRIFYNIEKTPRGTAGALRDALPILSPQFLLLYGDTYLDVNLANFFEKHLLVEANATLFLHPNSHPYDSDLVDIDQFSNVVNIYPYPHSQDFYHRNLVNAALYAIRNKSLESVTPAIGKADIAKDMFPKMLQLGMKLHGFISPEYVKDMGTPDRLDMVEKDIEIGIPDLLSDRQLRTAVFLDRDGTLNHEVNHLKSPDQLDLLPNVGQAVRQLNQSGILTVLITNQPVIAFGAITFDELRLIHNRLESLLGNQKAYVDAIYFCPHHPNKGFLGEIPELKFPCICRKPSVGMIDNACRDLKISRENSWLIGDTTTDMETGRRAGIKTILVSTGYAGRDEKYQNVPNYIVPNLIEAAKWITSGYAVARERLAPIAVKALSSRVILLGGLARSGKSFAAQVLKELLSKFGKKAHVISLDGWLKNVSERSEGGGVLERYKLTEAGNTLSNLAKTKQRVEFNLPIYDRTTREIKKEAINLSIFQSDILIIEGVPALYIKEKFESNVLISLYISEPEESRIERLRNDYLGRGYRVEDINKLIRSRAVDETSIIERSEQDADHIIELGIK